MALRYNKGPQHREMKNDNYTFLGLTITKEVPSTNDEFDKLAGETNAAVAVANDQYMYHVWAGKFREAFCSAVEKQTGITWPLNEDAMKGATPKKDGTVSEIHVAHGVYFKKVLAETGKTAAEFQELANEVAAKLPFDPSASSGGGRIGKEFTQAAAAVIAKGADALANVVATLNRLNPSLALSDDPSEEELARGIKANADRKKAEANAELGL